VPDCLGRRGFLDDPADAQQKREEGNPEHECLKKQRNVHLGVDLLGHFRRNAAAIARFWTAR
jgi:uncharacterized protein (DUF4415 family)